MNKYLPKEFFKFMSQSPNIPLDIPEGVAVLKRMFLSEICLFTLTCSFLLTCIILVGYDVRQNKHTVTVLQQEKQGMLAQITAWKAVLDRHQEYRDAWYQLAMLEYRIGDMQAAYEHVQQALVIDPEFKGAKELLVLVSKN